MNVGDKVKGSYGIGTVLSVNGRIAKVKFSLPIPIEMSVDFLSVIQDFQLNQLVILKNGEKGIVIDKKGDSAIVETLLSKDKISKTYNDIKSEDVTFVSTIGNSFKFKDNYYEVGGLVNHSSYGIGTIISLLEKSAVIKFPDGYRMISYDYSHVLEFMNSKTNISDVEILGDEEIDEELPEYDTFKVFPSNYSNQDCYSTYSKEVMSWAKKHYEHGIASVESFENENEEKKNSTGFILVPNKGVIVFKIYDFSDENDLPLMLKVLDKKYDVDKKKMFDKFMDSKVLCTFNQNMKILSFPFRYIYLLQGITINKAKVSLKNNKIEFVNENFYFKYFKSFSNNDMFSNFENYDKNFVNIDEKLYANIAEKVVPFLSTWGSQIEEKNIKKSTEIGEFVKITGHENEYEALFLDDEQIRFINRTRPGHWLTLANPGTGKSVVLLSKAHRLLSQNTTRNVLITCYNNNLCDRHLWFSELSGLRRSNLDIMTFHTMLKRLLEKYDLLDRKWEDLLYNEMLCDEYVAKITNLIELDKIQPIYEAIFIDEVQLLKPSYLKLCYALMKKGGYFELFGDLNQNIKSSKQKGIPTWKDKSGLNLTWTGRTNKYTKNYRNSININHYLNSFLQQLMEEMEKRNKKISEEDMTPIPEAIRVVKAKVKIFNKSKSSMQVRVVNMIKQIISKNNDYKDIAVIIPARQLKPIDYFLMDDLKRALDKEKIPYSIIVKENDGIPVRLSKARGVILTTIQSAMGLDFKNVIFCGTKMLNYCWPGGRMKCFSSYSSLDEMTNEILDCYYEVGRNIYEACSRARDLLIVLDDLPENSIIRDLFVPKGGKDYYDVR